MSFARLVLLAAAALVHMGHADGANSTMNGTDVDGATKTTPFGPGPDTDLGARSSCDVRVAGVGDYMALHFCPSQCIRKNDVVSIHTPSGRVVDRSAKVAAGTPGIHFSAAWAGIAASLKWDKDDGCLGDMSVSAGGRWLNVSGFGASCCDASAPGVGLTVQNFYDVWDEDECLSSNDWTISVYGSDGRMRSNIPFDTTTLSLMDCGDEIKKGIEKVDEEIDKLRGAAAAAGEPARLLAAAAILLANAFAW